MARYGQELDIEAHVGNPEAVDKVSLLLIIGGQVKRGKMVETASGPNVPVTVQPRSKSPLFSGPGSEYTVRGYVQSSDILQVTEAFNAYYRIKSTSGLSGFISKSTVRILSTGTAYRISLPAALTKREKLTYQIHVLDKYGRISTSEKVDVKFLTPEQVRNLMAKRNKRTAGAGAAQTTTASSRPNGKPIHKKGWFWLGLVAIGGGTYYVLSQNQTETETGTLDVLVDWE